jgi:hypothetical protein
MEIIQQSLPAIEDQTRLKHSKCLANLERLGEGPPTGTWMYVYVYVGSILGLEYTHTRTNYR